MKRIIIKPTGIEELELTTEEIAQKEKDLANAKLELQKLKDAEADKQTKKAKECIKQAYENDNFRSTRNWQNNNVVKSSRPIHSRRNKA